MSKFGMIKAAATYGKRACSVIVSLSKKHGIHTDLVNYIWNNSLEKMDQNVIERFRAESMTSTDEDVLNYYEEVTGLDLAVASMRITKALYDLGNALEIINDKKVELYHE